MVPRQNMTKGTFGFHGTPKDPALVDEWYVDSPTRTVTYTIRIGSLKTAFVYDCQLFENEHASSVSETIFGKQLPRAAVEKLPKFVALLADAPPP
jgi:hypothetical protein